MLYMMTVVVEYCSGLEREVRSNMRGEYWVVLLPGDYTLTASHSYEYGTLHCQVRLTLTSYLGEGARTEHLVLRPRYINS